jgi:putative glycosyltransferase (TIGR04372 family)
MLGIFSKWLDRPASFARHLDAGTEAYRQGNANVSIQHFRKCLEISPDRWEIVHRLAAVQADIVGDIDESVRLLRYARRLRNRLHNPPEGPPPYCFLQSPWGGDIAGIAAMEHVIKREILQGRDPKNIILYAPQHKQAPRNPLLDKMAAHVSIVTDENELPLPLHAMLSVLEDDVLCESLDGLHKQTWHAAADIVHAWENSRRGPLLNFSEDERTTGAAHLRKLGVPDDAWFVCVRENTADLGTYAPALDAVTRRGGWVVCLNRSNDAPRAAIPRVVHCAAQSHSPGEPEVFLLGACRFFIGGAGDHALVPPLFGVPRVLIDWTPAGRRPLNSTDLYIPTLYNAGSPRRLLAFSEMMAPPLGQAVRYEHARELDLAAVPNTADEICEAVEEMLDRFDGARRDGERDEALQAAFDAVAETNRCFGAARIGRVFLRRHSSLLMNV